MKKEGQQMQAQQQAIDKERDDELYQLRNHPKYSHISNISNLIQIKKLHDEALFQKTQRLIQLQKERIQNQKSTYKKILQNSRSNS